MIDIETLATTPNALVLSIGAVCFNYEDKIGDSIYLKPKFSQQFRHIDPETLDWWKSQDDETYKEAFTKDSLRLDVLPTLTKLDNFIKDNNVTEIWANSPSFDLIILEDLYRDNNLNIPWSYRHSRDVRTLKAVANLEPSWEPDIVDVDTIKPHHPIYDCVYQIKVVIECLNRINSFLDSNDN